MPIPERLQPIVNSVTASMSDADLAQLAGADGRLFSTLIWQRARLRDPFLDQLDAADRAVDDARVALQLAQQGGDTIEIEAAEHEVRRTSRALGKLINDMLDEYEATLPSAQIIPFKPRS